jgi:hypothetical protein
MDTQEAYELMRAWLTRPGAAISLDSVCMYRSSDGNRCAVGCLIPDNLYDDSIEGGTVVSWVHKENNLWKYFTNVDFDFLIEAQILHDLMQNWSTGKFNVQALDKLAIEFGLKLVQPETLEEILESPANQSLDISEALC